MPTMFWYFPFIVFTGALDMMLSPDNHRKYPAPVSDRDHNPVSPTASIARQMSA
jgi:hypothetical protein